MTTTEEDWSKDFTQGEVSDREVRETHTIISLYLMYMHVCAGMSRQQGVVNTLGVQRSCGQQQQQRGGIINLTGAMRTRGGGAIRRTGENKGYV